MTTRTPNQARGLYGLGRYVDSDRLLLKKYKLDKGERIDMLIRGVVLSQLAIYVGSAVYFIFLQTKVAWTYPKQSMKLAVVQWTDLWDRLPNHLGIAHGYAEPSWWVTARHDFRHVLIGFIAICLIGSITIGLKKRRRASVPYMVASIPAGLLIAILVATGLILFFNWATPFLNDFGSSSNNPYVNDLIGKGTIQLTIIGVVAGFAARALVLNRTFDTLQLMSLEQKLNDGVEERPWWRIIYAPSYRNRFRYLRDSGHQPQTHARWLGVVLSLSAPFLLFLMGFGIWLLNWGPAAHAH